MRKGLVLLDYVNINALEEDSRFRENDGVNSKGVDGRIKSGHDGVLWLPERWIATAAFSRLAMTV